MLHRRLRSDLSLRPKPRRLRYTGDSVLGSFAGIQKGIGVRSCFTTPHTPPTPSLSQPPPSAWRRRPAAPKPPESTDQLAPPPPPTLGTLLPSIGTHHVEQRYLSLSHSRFLPSPWIECVSDVPYGVESFCWLFSSRGNNFRAIGNNL